MSEICSNELEEIRGGSVNGILTGLAITAIVVFIGGLIEGITNPKECGCGSN